MTTEECNKLLNETKELYLVSFRMRIEDELVINAKKQVDEWTRYHDPNATEFDKNLQKVLIEALEIEETSLRQLRDKIQKEITKVSKY